MTQVDTTADELRALRAEVDALKRQGRGVVDVDPDFSDEMKQPPRSIPASPELKMQTAAKRMGGEWNPNPAWRKYGGVVEGRDGQPTFTEACPHLKPATCSRCWTKENEARWEFACGIANYPGPALDVAEAPASQKAGNITVADAEKRLPGRRLNS